MSVVEFTPDWREMKEQMRIVKGFEVNSRPIGEKGTPGIGHEGVTVRRDRGGHAGQAQQLVQRRQLLRKGGCNGVVGGCLRGLRTVDHGFWGPGHQRGPWLGGAAAPSSSGSPNSSSRLTPWRV